jgi:hypothetical protein
MDTSHAITRRSALIGAAVSGAALAVPAAAATPSTLWSGADLPDLLIDAVAAETACYRATSSAGSSPDPAIWQEAEKLTDAALDKVNAIERALLKAPAAANGSDDFRLALALCHKRWLVMEGAYQDQSRRTECRLVDAILSGTRLDAVPLLWHLSGDPRDRRPSDAELQAGWEARK